MAIGDVDGAFLNSDRDKCPPRENGPIYVSLPRDHLPPGVHQDQLCEVVNGYGLGDQPQVWWLTFSRFLVEEAGFTQHPLDPCVFLLFEPAATRGTVPVDRVLVIDPEATAADKANPGELCGVIGQHVDDGLFGGRGKRWHEAIAALKARFPYRKWCEGKGTFVGSWLEQKEDFSIEQSQG
eukprot:5528057-Lingulodinium_polyedra.AAC.2